MNNMIGKPQTIKKVNEDLIKNLIKKQGPITKPEISNITNLSLATVNKTVQKLLDKEKVKVSAVAESTGGRRAQLFEINGDLEYVIALYYYNHIFYAVVSNLIGEIIYKDKFYVNNSDYHVFMNDLFHVIDKLIEKSGSCRIKAIGLGVPGAVKNGVIKNIPNIRMLENVNLKKIIESKYNINTFVENDVNLATLGIYEKNYKEIYDSMFLVYVEDGLGSGIIINKNLYTGFSNFAGELNVMDIGEHDINSFNLEQVILNLKNKIKIEKEENLKESLMMIVSKTILNIVCILNPETVVIQCEVIKNEDINYVINYISNAVGKDNCPEIIVLESSKEHGLNGTINMCLKETTYQYSLSNIRGC